MNKDNLFVRLFFALFLAGFERKIHPKSLIMSVFFIIVRMFVHPRG